MSKRAKRQRRVAPQRDEPVRSLDPVADSSRLEDGAGKPWWRTPAWLALILSTLGFAITVVYKEIVKPIVAPNSCEQRTSISGHMMVLQLTGRLSFELGAFNEGRLLEIATKEQRIAADSTNTSLTNLEVVAGDAVTLTLTSAAEGENQSLRLEANPAESLVTIINDSGNPRSVRGSIQFRIRGPQPLELFGELAEPATLGLNSLEACWKKPRLKSLIVEKGTLVATRAER